MKSYNRLLALLIGLILAILVIAGNADAFRVKMINPTGDTVYFRFIWGDCNWKGFPKIYPVWTGEIGPGEIANSELDYYRAGTWIIEYKGMDGYILRIPSDKGILILNVSKKPQFLPGL